MNLIAHHWQDVLVLFAMGFVYQFRAWVVGKIVHAGERLTRRLQRWLVRSEREAIEWTHFRDRAAREGHQSRKVVICEDGQCIEIKK